MATDRELIKSAQKGQFGSTDVVTLDTAVAMLHRRHVTVGYLDIANTDQTVPIMRTDRAIRVISIRIATELTATADNTNYKTLQPGFSDDAGGAQTVLCTAISTTVAGLGFTALTSRAFTLTAANVEVASGKLIYLLSTTPGTGVALGNVLIDLVYEEV